jgi:hypothetical protein
MQQQQKGVVLSSHARRLGSGTARVVPKESELRNAILRERNKRALGESSPRVDTETAAIVAKMPLRDDTRDFWLLALKIAPFAFVLGGFMEFFMIKGRIGDTNFYETVLRKAGERR